MLMELRRRGVIFSTAAKLAIHDLEALQTIGSFSAEYLLTRKSESRMPGSLDHSPTVPPTRWIVRRSGLARIDRLLEPLGHHLAHHGFAVVRSRPFHRLVRRSCSRT